MIKVGLTGGIATGKSFVSSVLRELGCAVADADAIAHQVIASGQPAYEEITREFGPDVPGLVAETGAIDRAKLGAFVFNRPERLKRLNEIVHPRVFAGQERWIAEVAARDPEAVIVIDAALLIETGAYQRFDKVIVVYCDPELQIGRLMARNILSREAAQARISSQMPSAEKLRYADYSINTSGGFDETRRQVEAVYAELERLSSEHSRLRDS
ncbi:MAG TPA: dephospho-CoA kinase [Blastocatellia bacterium]|nr:dephospho-CoA kinase [Blastocatellia bacterium]